MSSGTKGAREYIFFCDESERRGAYFSNFYGGVRVSSDEILHVNALLLDKKGKLGLTSEVKWEKTDAKILDRYIEMMRCFFSEIAAGRLAVRIMFTQNNIVPTGLTEEQNADSYFLLYYQFLKHAFGLRAMPPHDPKPRVRIYLDEIGETREKVANFRGFLGGLPSIVTAGRTGFSLDQEDITEVRSHDHILMQCLDVVLGSMPFRLNNKHKVIPQGLRRLGKRTVAKEKLYKFILSEIQRVTKKPHFNIGITTGTSGDKECFWSDPYRHWRFLPKQYRHDSTFTKRKAGAPLGPT